MNTSRTVGSRELKTRLGTYLERVRNGETLILTDRGRPVAELKPITRSRDPIEARMDEMAALGLITRATRKKLTPFKPIKGVKGSLSSAIIEDRKDRF
jgi:prevent-host-death family protein